VCRFGDLELFNGRWSVIGKLPGWDKAAWPTPAFTRKQLVSGKTLKVVYADDDPARLVSETEIHPSAIAEYPEDGLMGAQAVALVLNSRLPKIH